MASKRSLYQPAQQDTVGHGFNRKPLTQGRLISQSDSALGAEISQTESPSQRLYKPGTDGSYKVSYDGSSTGDLSPRQKLSSHKKVHSDHQVEDVLSSPRRAQPNQTEHHSPKRVTPSRLLELSDSDDEVAFKTRRSPRVMQHIKHSPAPNVLVVDASRQTRQPLDTEVDIHLGFEHSPVKVVCHSPGAVHSDLRNTGDTAAARRVQVDQVPSVNILSGNTDIPQSDQERPGHRFKSPMVIREAAVAGGKIDHHSAVETVDTTDHLTRPMREDLQYQTYKQPRVIIGDSGIPGVEPFPQSDTASVDEVYHEVKPKLKGSVVEPSAKKEKKKQSKERIVPSRYMQSGTSSRHRGQSLVGKSGARSSATETKKTHKRPVVTKKRTAPDFSTTPMVRGVSKMASTPAVDTSSYPQPGPIDVSAIAADLPHLSMAGPPSKPTAAVSVQRPPSKTLSRTKHKQPKNVSVKEDSTREMSSQHLSSASVATQDSAYSSHSQSHTTKKKSSPSRITQESLDLQYARYLQWVFLETKAKKEFHEQEKQVVAQLYGLWEENQRLLQKKAEVEQTYEQLKHANKLDELLELQKAGLGPVAANLPGLRQQYSTLAQALDTTRHQILCRGVHIPENEEDFQEAMLSALAESEQLLGELSVMTRQEQPKVTSFANAIQALEKAVDEESKELKRCQEMQAAVQTLATQESSLKIQAVQIRDEE
ncbi:uncharacterized protein LOC106176487 [Lingula anatina]|uniref:Uncharacterized protein LOC106176487 n=1 Tax=Lingula anatina TaxID=7574 RepID=A0A2R2MT83_LINAN|nr:uncharacterized protein LOC106176487 [Lingula anatina]|eukprot:XP_023933475.1 uncharacterized protein LOC106176487 [Lingula anatina]